MAVKNLDDTIAFIRKNFPDEAKDITPERIAKWEAEIASGARRTADEIRQDILKYVVGVERVKAWVAKEFDDRGLNPASGGESADARTARIAGEIMSSKRTFNNVSVTLDKYGKKQGAGGPPAGSAPPAPPAPPPPETIVELDEEVKDDVVAPVGDAGKDADGSKTYPGILAGGTIYRIRNPKQEDYYVVAYEYPPSSGEQFYYRFDSLESLEAAVGPNLGGGKIAVGNAITEERLRGGGWTDAGNSNEVVGVKGTFVALADDIVREAALDAGIEDPTKLGKAMADPDIQTILLKSAEGEWSDARTKAALRKTDYYKDVLYPGIENFYGQTDDPESAYRQYINNTRTNLERLGVPKDADGSYASTNERLLDGGVSDTELATFTPTYTRAVGNDAYRQSLNKWLVASGQAPITDFDTFFDVLEGTTDPAMNEVIELASIGYVVENVGIGVDDGFVREIAKRTDLSEPELAQMFTQGDRDLMALGPAGLRSYGLTQEDVIASRLGYASGRLSVAEQSARIAKVKQEQGIKDDPTAKFFTDYDAEGAPVKAGLRSSVAEGA